MKPYFLQLFPFPGFFTNIFTLLPCSTVFFIIFLSLHTRITEKHLQWHSFSSFTFEIHSNHGIWGIEEHTRNRWAQRKKPNQNKYVEMQKTKSESLWERHWFYNNRLLLFSSLISVCFSSRKQKVFYFHCIHFVFSVVLRQFFKSSNSPTFQPFFLTFIMLFEKMKYAWNWNRLCTCMNFDSLEHVAEWKSFYAFEWTRAKKKCTQMNIWRFIVWIDQFENHSLHCHILA